MKTKPDENSQKDKEKDKKREKVYLEFLNKNLISFEIEDDGQIHGTGLLNPVLEMFRFPIMLGLQSRLYTKYKNLATYRGRRVSNTFAPPLGSGPQWRAFRNVLKSRFTGRPVPSGLTFACTFRCQLDCEHCSAANRLRDDVPELSTAEAKKLIDEALDLGIVTFTFTGGEPLIREDIFELISHVNPDKAVSVMFTNGEYLTDETIDKLIDAELYSLFVSLDSHIPEEHDRRRGRPGLFKVAVEGIRRAKEKGLLVGISSYASRSGTERGDYRKLHALAQELGAHNVFLLDAVPVGKYLKNTNEVLTMDQREEIYEFSSRIFENEIIPPLSAAAWQSSVPAYLADMGCLTTKMQFGVTAYGELTPCEFIPLSFGSVRDESLKSLFSKLATHPAFDPKRHVQRCRMQHPKFRQYYIDPIPEDACIPYPIEKLERVDFLNDRRIG